MQLPKPCNTYHAVLTGKDIFRGADAKTIFKVYFFDIIGRKEPSRTVWSLCGLTQKEFMARLATTESVEGIGFITAFPHISKVFRFGPEVETNIHVRAWNTKEMKPLDLSRGDGYIEFGCLVEAAVAAEEFSFWAKAKAVNEYLRQWSLVSDAPVLRNDKLQTYWK